jgi:hypothetical protein
MEAAVTGRPSGLYGALAPHAASQKGIDWRVSISPTLVSIAFKSMPVNNNSF